MLKQVQHDVVSLFVELSRMAVKSKIVHTTVTLNSFQGIMG
jgi:hypothetical protein